MPLYKVIKGEHRGKLSPEYCRRASGVSKSEKFTPRSKAGHIPNGIDGKLFDRCFAHDEGYQRQKFGFRKIQDVGTAQK